MKNTYLGQATVVYNVNPTVITAVTDTVIVPNPIAEEFLNNFVAARTALKYNPDIADYYFNEANKLFAKIVPIQPADEEEITDAYGGNYNYSYGGHYG